MSEHDHGQTAALTYAKAQTADTGSAIREAASAAEVFRLQEATARAEALKADHACDLDKAGAWAVAAEDLRFRAESLERAAMMLGAMRDYEPEVRALVRDLRAKSARKTAPRSRAA